MTLIKIIYASTSGNTELVCEFIADILQKENFSVQLFRSELCDVQVFDDSKFFILATSTWEHGEVNPYFTNLLNSMMQYDFSNKFAGFIGLGDVRYEPVFFTRGIDEIEKVFTANSGTKLCETLRINGEPHDQLEELVIPWVKIFKNQILQNEK
ncbi:MAG: flavodoxin [Candidatus Dojkabacteria bacterium]|nr:MAG: flavodoxin [Candidatus Dojkabacteria bacterium]